MTQIRSMAQPVQRRPGELGVHSLDHFNFVVPDVAQAEKFYGLFGLNTKEEDGKLGLYTHGHPHRWGVVSEGPRTGGALKLANAVNGRLGESPRVVVLGHVQRGGSPTARDRLLASTISSPTHESVGA